MSSRALVVLSAIPLPYAVVLVVNVDALEHTVGTPPAERLKLAVSGAVGGGGDGWSGTDEAKKREQ